MNQQLSLRVCFFGMTADASGCEKTEIRFTPTTDELRSLLQELYPALVCMQFAIAVNHQLISGNTTLYGGDEVALLPPFSGG